MTLYEYLIKNIDMDIDKQFIKEFYEIQQNTGIFPVNLEIVANWLDVTIENMVYTLKKRYVINDDYVVRQIVTKSLGNHHKKTYLLTLNCFQLMILRSHAAKAEIIRKYYIALERLVNKYRKLLYDEYKKQIQIIKYNNDKYVTTSGIYIIEKQTLSFGKIIKKYKIGKTKNLKKRMAVYNTKSSNKVIVKHFFNAVHIHQIELCVQFALQKYQCVKHKEFYKCPLNKLISKIKQCINIYDISLQKRSLPKMTFPKDIITFCFD